MRPTGRNLVIGGIVVIVVIIIIAAASSGGSDTSSPTPSRTTTESTRSESSPARQQPAPISTKRPFSVSGRGSDYVEATTSAAAGNYVCSISVLGNTGQFGAEYIGIVSYGGEGEYGSLHVNEGASSVDIRSRLVIGNSFASDLPPGAVWFEVEAAASARWSISCE